MVRLHDSVIATGVKHIGPMANTTHLRNSENTNTLFLMIFCKIILRINLKWNDIKHPALKRISKALPDTQCCNRLKAADIVLPLL